MKSAIIFVAAAFVLAGCAQNDKPVVLRVEDPQHMPDVQLAKAQESPEKTVGKVDPVALFSGPMPTGVAVSKSGRIFVCFPRWGDPVEYTVAEIVNGQAVAYPDAAVNKLNEEHPEDCLISVQSVVIDGNDRLWVLDTGSINFQSVSAKGPKLICYDLQTNREIKRITFANSALSTSYLNDVRFALGLGREGFAFITDSSDQGPNAIIVADLSTGESWRRLEGNQCVTADQDFAPIVEGEPLMVRTQGRRPASMKMGSDGIAISPDGNTLYFSPLSSRRIYSASPAMLADRDEFDEEACERSVSELPQRDYASDGLECDASGRLYLTDYEHNAIHRRNADGTGDEIIAQDPRMIWPDSLCAAADGMLYFTCNQLDRQPRFHDGKDLRQQPYLLLRTSLRPERISMQ